MSVSVTLSDCVAWLKAYEGPLFDSCVTDPPYHLSSIVKRFGAGNAAPAKVGATGAYARASRGFMGKEWDGGDVAFRPETWRAVFDRLKPGAHLAAFSGTRTYHRMACAIEDAGFEISDQLAWVYGSGFPKSHNIGLAADKLAGLGPRGKAFILKGRGERADELDANGRVFLPSYEAQTETGQQWQGWGTALKPAWEPICLARKPISEKSVAANVLKHGTGAINVDGCRVGTETTVTVRNGISGGNGAFGLDRRAGSWENPPGRFPANLCHDGSDEVLAGFPDTTSGTFSGHRNEPKTSGIYGAFDLQDERGHTGDSGSAARFFYSAKAGPLDRIGSKHATVKPVDLMRWLVRLVTPPGGLILEPFAGSGTTGIAAMAEGFDCTMIEMESDHVADIERKLAYLRGEGAMTFREHDRRRDDPQGDAGPLFEAVA